MGCGFLWVSSFAVSAARGMPDAGLLEASTMVSTVDHIARVITLPVVVDMDAGYGDPLKVLHAVDRMTRSGATAVCIEDNPVSKRSSLYSGYDRILVSIEEQCARIEAAKSGIAGRPCGVIARTEALVAGLGTEEALARADAYTQSGADAVFVQAVSPNGLDELLAFCESWARRTFVFIAPTCYTHYPRSQMHAAGASHYIFANQGVRAAHGAMATTFRNLLDSEVGLEAEEGISSVADVAAEVGEHLVAAP